MIFQAVQILVTFTANFTFVWFLLFHAHGPWVGRRSLGIHDGECAICVIVQLLVIVAVLQAVLVIED